MAQNKKKNIKFILYFSILHLVLWTVVPSVVNQNLPLDTIEALAWGSNLDWGFNKHPPLSAFFQNYFFLYLGHKIGCIIFKPNICNYFFLFCISNYHMNF